MMTKEEFFELIGKDFMKEMPNPDRLYKEAIDVLNINDLEQINKKASESRMEVICLGEESSGKITPEIEQAYYEYWIILGRLEFLLKEVRKELGISESLTNKRKVGKDNKLFAENIKYAKAKPVLNQYKKKTLISIPHTVKIIVSAPKTSHKHERHSTL